MEKLLQKMDEYIRADNDFRQRREEAYRYFEMTRGFCRCFGSDRTPGVAPQGVFRSRTVSTTVAKWFVPITRETVDKIYRFGPLRDA